MVLLRLVFFGLGASCLTQTLALLLVPQVKSVSSLSSWFVKIFCILPLFDLVVCEITVVTLDILVFHICLGLLLEPISSRRMLRRRSRLRKRSSHKVMRNLALRLLVHHRREQVLQIVHVVQLRGRLCSDRH